MQTSRITIQSIIVLLFKYNCFLSILLVLFIYRAINKSYVCHKCNFGIFGQILTFLTDAFKISSSLFISLRLMCYFIPINTLPPGDTFLRYLRASRPWVPERSFSLSRFLSVWLSILYSLFHSF